MKADDIPQLVYISGGFQLAIYDIEDWLIEYNKRYGIDINPDFQRPLVWSENHKIKFMEFLLKGGNVLPIMWNSPGYGGLTPSKDCDLGDEILLVDGKQRLNCIIDFMNNKVPVFGGYFKDDIEGIDPHLRRTNVLFRVNRLSTKRELLKWYLELNEGQIAHTQEELDRIKTMAKNLENK